MTRFIQEGLSKLNLFKFGRRWRKLGFHVHWEPYHCKIQEYNDLNYGKLNGSTSNKILIRYEGIIRFNKTILLGKKSNFMYH